MNNYFVKTSALTGEDRTKLKSYWSELWGSEFANAVVKDYKPDGNKKSVEANSKKKNITNK